MLQIMTSEKLAGWTKETCWAGDFLGGLWIMDSAVDMCLEFIGYKYTDVWYAFHK